MRRTLLRTLVAAGMVAGMIVPGAGAEAEGASIHCVGTVAGTDSWSAVPYDHTDRCTASHSTIQGAVDAAGAGDLVLIGPGNYREAVRVNDNGHSRAGLVIRGTDRNTVEVQGDAAGAGTMSHGFNITSPNVEVSNLTVFHYRNTGVFWVGTSGYTSRYVTAFNNGVYGLYAFDTSGPGLWEESYGSGHPDAAFYIGECNPCDATITDVLAENNGLGYSGTNASGGIVIEDSLWVNNAGGIVPNTLDSEELPPQCCIVIRNNTVIGSGSNPDSPTNGATAAATGFGIASAGGMYNLIEDNKVFGSSRYGIVVFPFPHETPNAYRAAGNIVRNNEVADSGVYDLSLALGSGDWNCFSGNSFATSDPPSIETLYPCSIQGSALRNLPVSGGAVSTAELVSGLARFQPNPNYLEQPEPQWHATMPNPLAGF